MYIGVYKGDALQTSSPGSPTAPKNRFSREYDDCSEDAGVSRDCTESDCTDCSDGPVEGIMVEHVGAGGEFMVV